MLRIVSAAIRGIAAARNNAANLTVSGLSKRYSIAEYVQKRSFGALSSPTIKNLTDFSGKFRNATLRPETIETSSGLVSAPSVTQIRTVTKFSLKTGKRKTVHAVVDRFYRLNWGIWIRTKAGRHRHLWKKSAARKKRLREHVFCNATQSYMLDKMVTKFWRRPRFYVDDPYNPYQKREEFILTRKQPLP